MHRLVEGFRVSKWASHLEIFNKSNIPKFSFHFLYNKKGFEIIECHVQGTIRHCMNNNNK
jgi:hypothetical protein